MKKPEFLRCEFTEEEMREFSKTLARETQNLSRAEEQKKVATSQYAEQIARHKAEMSLMSHRINNGYEMRMVDCSIELDKPVRGTATIIRADTGELVRERAMTQEEMQMELPMAAKA